MSFGENPLSTDTRYVYPDTGFKLTSTVKNEGTKFINEPVTFKFTMTAGGETTDLGTQTLSYLWGAGKLMSASIDVPAPGEVADDLTFDAEVTIGDTVINQSMRAVKEYNIILDGDALLEETTGGHRLSVPLRNDGNIPSGEAAVKLYTVKDGEKDKLIKEFNTGSIAENSTLIIGGAVEIPDEAYVIFSYDGTSRAQDLLEAIPSTLYKTVKVQVTVTDDTSDSTTEESDIRDRKTPGTPAAPVQEGSPEETPAPENVEFGDIEKHWAKGYIERLSELGIINGRDTGGFDPQATITRGEIASIICKILDLIKGGLNND